MWKPKFSNIANYKAIQSDKKRFFTCPYCWLPAKVISSKQIYGVNYGKMWHCSWACDAYVGCHPGTQMPLWTLANRELREWRKKAHAAFDPLWRSRWSTRRKKKYAWLSKEMGVESDFCHIWMFNIEQCKKVIELSIAYLHTNNGL